MRLVAGELVYCPAYACNYVKLTVRGRNSHNDGAVVLLIAVLAYRSLYRMSFIEYGQSEHELVSLDRLQVLYYFAPDVFCVLEAHILAVLV